jgi:hypothetical protein
MRRERERIARLVKAEGGRPAESRRADVPEQVRRVVERVVALAQR